MFNLNQQLKTPADFDNAMYFSIPVTVYQDNQIIDYGGVIERHSELTVFINGGFFFKELCEFKVKKVSISR